MRFVFRRRLFCATAAIRRRDFCRRFGFSKLSIEFGIGVSRIADRPYRWWFGWNSPFEFWKA